MYEVGISYKGRRAPHIVIASHGILRKLPGGIRLVYAEGDYQANVTLTNADAIRLYHALGSALLPKPEVA